MIEELEAATEETAVLFYKVWRHVYDTPPSVRYMELVQLGAWVDAALMILPEGWGGILGIGKGGYTSLWRGTKDQGVSVKSKGPSSIALLIVSLKARELK